MAKSIVQRGPFHEAVSLRDAIDRLFEDSLVRPGGLLSPTFEGPAVDMYQTDEEVIVKASVPGVKPEDIDVSVTGDILTIKGEFKGEDRVEKDQYIYQERRYGEFSRQMTLPTSVRVDKAQAEFEHGVLVLRLPKTEAAKPKSIKVKVK